MPKRSEHLAGALAPVILLAQASLWTGTFYGGAGSAAQIVFVLFLLGFALASGRGWRDPLGVGGLPVLLLLVSVAGSLLASPVPRVGLESVVLLPALLLVPSAVARCWRTERRRLLATRGMSLLMASVICVAVTAWWVTGGPAGLDEPAMPLGHANLLAAWIVGTLPLAALPTLESSGWRWAGLLALFAGLAVVLSASSMAAAAALLVQVLWLVARRGTGRHVGPVVLATVLLVGTQWARLGEILNGRDLSLLARLSYWKAAWLAFLDRPALGWGPQSMRWLLAEHFRPRAGVNPPGQLVCDVHSLPLQTLAELGASGALFVGLLVALFVRRRLREQAAEPRATVEAGLAGLVGLAVMAAAGRLTAAPALPLLAAILIGAALRPGEGDRPRASAPVLAYATVALLALVPIRLASFFYERALARSSGSGLEKAVTLDPSFPLYRARRAWVEIGEEGDERRASVASLEAARRARGLAPLWLAAGVLGQRHGESWSNGALERSCELDPLAAAAPFFLMLGETDPQRRATFGARAILADPRLAAAVYWDENVGAYAAAVRRVARWPGLDPAWRRSLLPELWSLLRQRRHERPLSGRRSRWLAELDVDPPSSVSLHAFRRLAWPVVLGGVELRRDALDRLDMPPATALRETATGPFSREACRAAVGASVDEGAKGAAE